MGPGLRASGMRLLLHLVGDQGLLLVKGRILNHGPPEVSLALDFSQSAPCPGPDVDGAVSVEFTQAGSMETVVLPRSERTTQGDATGGTRSPAPAPSDPHPALPGPC